MSTTQHPSLSRTILAFVLVFLALTSALPSAAQEEPVEPAPQPFSRPQPRPPDSKPSVVVPPSQAPRAFGVISASAVTTITAGDTYTETIPVPCGEERATVDLSVSVSPPGIVAATFLPTRLTTPADATLTFPTANTTPAGTYVVTLVATVVSGPCRNDSTTRTLEVERPVRLQVQPTSQTISAGQGTSYTITIRRTNFSGRVELRATGLPSDIQANFSPPETRGDTSTLTLNVPQGSTSCPPPAGCEFRIRGRANVEVQSVSARLVVRKEVKLRPDAATKSILTGETATFAVQVLRSGYAGAVELKQERLEVPNNNASAISGFDPDGFSTAETVRFQVSVGAGGQGRYSFRLTPTLPPTISDVAVESVKVTVEATPPRGVDITVTPPSISIPAGESATYQIQIVKFGVPSVRFGINGLPPKAQAFPDRDIDPTSVRIQTAADTPNGIYRLSVLGIYDEDGKIISQQANSVDLVVGPPAQPALSLRLGPLSFNVQSEQSLEITATVTRLNGCQGQIRIFETVSPVTAFGAFDFQQVSPDTFRARPTAATVTVETPTTINVSVSAFGCTAASDSISGTVRPKIFIPPQVTTVITPTSQSASSGQTVRYTMQLNRGTSTDPISLTVSGLPPGVSAMASPNPVTGPSAEIQVTVGNGVPAGASTLTVTGQVGATVVTSASVGLTVTGGPASPTITSFSPLNGTAGTNVQIFGSGFVNVQNVTFNGVGAAFAPLTPTQVNATVPGFATTGRIQVTTATGTATSPKDFVVGTSVRMPVITGFSPPSGPDGVPVTIFGVNLDGATAVTFGGIPASFAQPTTASQVDTTVPTGARNGFIQVTTPNGTATSRSPFAVQ